MLHIEYTDPGNDENRPAYELIKEELMAQYPGKWVLMYKKKVIAIDESYEHLWHLAVHELGLGDMFFLTQLVEKKEIPR